MDSSPKIRSYILASLFGVALALGLAWYMGTLTGTQVEKYTPSVEKLLTPTYQFDKGKG